MEVCWACLESMQKIRGRLLMYPRTFLCISYICLFRKSISTIFVCLYKLYKLFSRSYKISNTNIAPFTVYFNRTNWICYMVDGVSLSFRQTIKLTLFNAYFFYIFNMFYNIISKLFYIDERNGFNIVWQVGCDRITSFKYVFKNELL